LNHDRGGKRLERRSEDNDSSEVDVLQEPQSSPRKVLRRLNWPRTFDFETHRTLKTREKHPWRRVFTDFSVAPLTSAIDAPILITTWQPAGRRSDHSLPLPLRTLVQNQYAKLKQKTAERVTKSPLATRTPVVSLGSRNFGKLVLERLECRPILSSRLVKSNEKVIQATRRCGHVRRLFRGMIVELHVALSRCGQLRADMPVSRSRSAKTHASAGRLRVDKLVIAGVDTILGGNIAAWFSDRYDVIGLSFGKPVRIQGCETLKCPSRDPLAIQNWIASERPKWIVFCGPWAESAWNGNSNWIEGNRPAELIRPWVAGAAAIGCNCTVMSSDAVFTSPWMFHDEESTSFSSTPEAQALLQMEQTVAEVNPDAMIVRSHVFGWAPFSETEGFIEQTLAQMYSGRRMNLDCVRHATPILATDLAEVLEQAYGACLSGLYHIGGAERLNPYRMGTLLATQFGCPYTPSAPLEPLTERSAEFGAGETSLQSLKIRKALGISLPLVSEGLERLHAQSLNGYRDQFETVPAPREEQLAA